jgi:pyrroloquinoline quinone biosynthesis protein D
MSDETRDKPGSAGQGAIGRQRAIVSAASRPVLARGRRLHHDAARDRWVIQAPERVLSPDPIAVEVLKLCDGRRTVAEVAESLATRYTAPRDQIETDIIAMLQDLADKGVVSCTPTLLR